VPSSSKTAYGCPESRPWGRRLMTWFRPLHGCLTPKTSCLQRKLGKRGRACATRCPPVHASVCSKRPDSVIPDDRSGLPGFYLSDVIIRLGNRMYRIADVSVFGSEVGCGSHVTTSSGERE